MFVLIACGENKNTDVVETGTYQGVLQEVDPGEKEIYVKTADDKLIELYFVEKTKVVNEDGSAASFENLEQNGKVEVEVEKKGNKNVPISVKILN
jgi:hypothetical protein